ncbi:uroporphyrinogen-III C-methyltransferase [Carnobacterium gallinarum]|uniref:uroporphyrinogen-III C-methyltransferase n=1 Tax=Carnobacterium gallinarum TaxID=2749 RepID=UPI000553E852|nr:uroporphyrinogen-III C-methyltransferase [Carnobacterium gallinarum]
MSGLNSEKGKVYLVGGGSGDIELLTLKGARVIREADVIIYDRLVNPLFLYLAKLEAEFIYCGKLPQQHTLKQEEIEAKIVEEALAGKLVVRLKGGDPGVFGRVGEEMAILEQQTISYEVIPGITAASAASIYAGIPLTHRQVNSHVTLATGHRQVNQPSPMDFATFARGGTLILYMGVENLATICAELLENEIAGRTPIAIVTWGSYGRQVVLTGTLATIVEDAKAQKVINPSLIIIGEVVTKRSAISWFEKLPLFGRKILLVSQKPLEWDQLTHYSSQGADIWGIQLGSCRDSRLDEVTMRLLNEQTYDEVIFLEEENSEVNKMELLFHEFLEELKIDRPNSEK